MPKITYIDSTGELRTIDVEKGLTVMEGAVQNQIPGIDADCGGGSGAVENIEMGQ